MIYTVNPIMTQGTRQMDQKLLASLGLISAVGLTQISPDAILKLLSGLSGWQMLMLAIQGSIMVGSIRLADWKGRMPIYLIRCPEHGFQLTYKQGFGESLICPKCIQGKSGS